MYSRLASVFPGYARLLVPVQFAEVAEGLNAYLLSTGSFIDSIIFL